jgi:hypothetical protein
MKIDDIIDKNIFKVKLDYPLIIASFKLNGIRGVLF